MATPSAEVSVTRGARARNFHSQILQSCNRIGQDSLARSIGVDGATISRLISTHLPKLCDLIALCDLKVVPSALKCYRPESVAALMQLAKERMDQLESPDDLLDWSTE